MSLNSFAFLASIYLASVSCTGFLAGPGLLSLVMLSHLRPFQIDTLFLVKWLLVFGLFFLNSYVPACYQHLRSLQISLPKSKRIDLLQKPIILALLAMVFAMISDADNRIIISQGHLQIVASGLFAKTNLY